MLQQKIFLRLKLVLFSAFFSILSIQVANGQSFVDKTVAFFGGGGSQISKFKLNRQFTIVAQTSDDTTREFCRRLYDFLQLQGCENMIFSSAEGSRNIVVEMVSELGENSVEGGDVYSIRVYGRRVEVKFTSAKSSLWAYKEISESVVTKQNGFQKVLKRSSCYINPLDVLSGNGVSNHGVVIDASKGDLTIAQLRSSIEKHAHNHHFDVKLKLFSADGLAVASQLLEPLNPDVSLCKSGYSYAELSELAVYAKKMGVSLTPVLDFANGNNHFFTSYTGHPIHSTEGMRFVVPFLREFIANSSFSTISLGFSPEQSDSKDKNGVEQNKFYILLVKTCKELNVNIQ